MHRLIIAFALIVQTGIVGASGFNDDFEIRMGDANGDGLTDLYVQEKPRIILIHGSITIPITLPPSVEPFLLTAGADGTFTIDDAVSVARSWPIAPLSLIPGDYNVDGTLDLLIRGFSDAGLGANDQFVFASPDSNTTLGLKGIDAETQAFFDQLAAVMQNPDYFEQNAPVTTQTQVVNDFLFLAEYCATPEWVAQNGPLSALPPLGTLFADSLDEIFAIEASFITDCNLSGRTVFHYDLVSVQYVIQIGTPDYSVFNQDALEIARHIIDAQDLGEILQKEAIRIILERIFGVGVFGDDIDDEYVLRVLFEIIEFLQKLDPTGECIDTPALVNHSIGLASHTATFRANIDMSSKITVDSDPNNNVWITVGTLAVDAPDDIIADVLVGIERWTVCRTGGINNTQFRLAVFVREATDQEKLFGTADVIVERSDDTLNPRCRDTAELGGKRMTVCAAAPAHQIQKSVQHEFGHILGLDDKYDTSIDDRCVSDTGFNRDIMSCGSNIFAYHLQVIAQQY